jgi:DNA-binding protein Fis
MWVSSVALSKDLKQGSVDQITQATIQEEVGEALTGFELLSGTVNVEFAHVRSAFEDPVLDTIMIQTRSIKEAYADFVKTSSEPDTNARDLSMKRFQ